MCFTFTFSTGTPVLPHIGQGTSFPFVGTGPDSQQLLPVELQSQPMISDGVLSQQDVWFNILSSIF